MPTYQYACTACGHRFEQVQSFYDDALTHCPECDGRLRKVFNAVGVVFKGSGFYRNDSRSEGSGRSRETAKDGASKDGASKDGASKDGSSKDGAKSGSTGGSSGESSSGTKDSSGSKAGAGASSSGASSSGGSPRGSS